MYAPPVHRLHQYGKWLIGLSVIEQASNNTRSAIGIYLSESEWVWSRVIVEFNFTRAVWIFLPLFQAVNTFLQRVVLDFLCVQPFHNALDIKSSYLICFKGFIINLHILQSRSSRQCKSPHCRFLQVTSYLPACRNRRKCHHPFRYRNPFRWQYALQRYRSYPYSV